MARHFNGAYSVRAGSRSVKDFPSTTVRNYWTCPQGHRNPHKVLVDERDRGGACYERWVTECERCGDTRQVERVEAR